MFSFQTLLKGTFSLLTCHLQFSITARVSMALKRQSVQSLSGQKICDARGKYPPGDILTSNQKRKRNNPLKSVPGCMKASALKLLFKNVQIACLKFRISPFVPQRCCMWRSTSIQQIK